MQLMLTVVDTLQQYKCTDITRTALFESMAGFKVRLDGLLNLSWKTGC